MRVIPKPKHITLYESKCFFNAEMYEEKIVNSLNEQEYILEATFDGGVTLKAGSEQGLFYGRSTFEQIRTRYSDAFPAFRIEDSPSFEYRSFLIDCSRHYFPVAELERIIDSMAFLKFNVFHWHLCDDQGWRIESRKYPDLHLKASKRFGERLADKNDNAVYGGYYTTEEMKHIVAFCKERFIDVVPEIDVPGHSSALLSVIPEISCWGGVAKVKSDKGIFEDVLCPAKDKTYEVLKDIFEELFEIFPFGYYHIGGDEAPTKHWEDCPDCKGKMAQLGLSSFADYKIYFMNKIADFLRANGKTAIVWNDCLGGNGLNGDIAVQYWKENGPALKHSIEWANSGKKVILSPYSRYYMDLPYGFTSLKKTFSFNGTVKGLDLRGRENIIGVETCLWSEFVSDARRMQYMMFPRVLAVAQTAWLGNCKKSYTEFLKSCDIALKALKRKGIVPAPKKVWNPLPLHRLVNGLAFLCKNSIISGVLTPASRKKGGNVDE